MKTEIININPFFPDARAVTEAARVIKKGGIIAFPTETIYGLGVDARNETAVRRIYEIKNRPAHKPILILIPSQGQLGQFVTEIPPVAEKLMKVYWPGALTIVFPAKPTTSSILRGGGQTIGIRIPPHAATLALLRECDCPLTAPSANLADGKNPLTAQDVLDQLGDRIDLILDAGPSLTSVPSTVIDVTKKPPQIIRSGAVSVADEFLRS